MKPQIKCAILAIASILFIISGRLVVELPVLVTILNLAWPIMLLYLSRSFKKNVSVLWIWLILLIAFNLKFIGLYGMDSPIEYHLLCAGHISLFATGTFLAYLLDKLLINKLPIVLNSLIFPASQTVIMMLTQLMGFGNFTNFTNYITSIPIISQSFSVVGEIGLAFIILWIESCILCAFMNKNYKVYATTAIVMILIVVGFGAFRLATQHKSDNTAKIALATRPESADFSGSDDEYSTPVSTTIKFITDYIKQAADSNCDFLCTAEEAVYINEADEGYFVKEVGEDCAKYHMPCIIGVEFLPNDEEELSGNLIYVFDENGNWQKNSKEYLFYALEDGVYEKGEDGIVSGSFKTKNSEANYAAIICFGITNEKLCVEVPANSNLIFCPSFDCDYANLFAYPSGKVCAYNTGCTIIRQVFDGYSFIQDTYGNMIYMQETKEPSTEITTVVVPIIDEQSIFPNIINILYIIFPTLFVLLVILGVSKSVKERIR